MIVDSKSSKFFGLYNSIHGSLMSYIMMMVHNQTAAEDLLQETATIMWEQFDHFQEGTNFTAWAMTIARNKTLEYLRDNRRTKKLLHHEFYTKLSHVAEHSAQDYSLRVNALDDCLKKMDAKDKKLIILRYQDNISVKDISLKIGRPASTLYFRISHIINLLNLCISRSLSKQEL